MSPSNERDVLGGARSGDRAALTVLWGDLNSPLLRYLRARLGQGAEDIAAQTWLDAARGLARFRGDESEFRRWLFTIARRRLVDELRRRGRRREQLGAIVDEGRDDLALESIDDLERALAMVRRLRADQADAVLLRVVADLDVAQVADVMGRSEGSVRVLVHRGLRRLRELAEADVTELERSAMYWEQ